MSFGPAHEGDRWPRFEALAQFGRAWRDLLVGRATPERKEALLRVAANLDGDAAGALAGALRGRPDWAGLGPAVEHLAHTAPPVPAFRVGAVLYDVEWGDGVVLWLRSSPATDAAPLASSDRSERAIEAALRGALVRRGLPHDPEHVAARVRSVCLDLPSTARAPVAALCRGPSMDLAVALQAWAELVGLARPCRVLAAGELEEDGAVRGVGALPYKLAGAVAEGSGFDVVLLPKGGLDAVRERPPKALPPERLVEVASFEEAIERLGFLPNSVELRERAERADVRHLSSPAEVRTLVALLEREAATVEAAGRPDPRWGEARYWAARLGRTVMPGDPVRTVEALADALERPGAGAATAPGILARAAAEALDFCVDHLRWHDIERVGTLLASSGFGRFVAEGSPVARWMHHVYGAELARLDAMLGHALLQLERLDEARVALARAIVEAPPAELGRGHIHLARVELRARRLDAAADALDLATPGVAAARAASILDRTQVNLDLVRWRLEGERHAPDQPHGGGDTAVWRSFADFRGWDAPLHDDDVFPVHFAACRRAWIARDRAAWDVALAPLRDTQLPLDPLIVATLDAVADFDPDAPVDLHALLAVACRAGAREDLFEHHVAFRGRRYVPARDAWRMPYLLS